MSLLVVFCQGATMTQPMREVGRMVVVIGYEALCGKCGDTFNPLDAYDLEHVQRVDGTYCGGRGELKGWWGSFNKPTGTR